MTGRHGVLPLPAPATLACLRGVPTFDLGLDAELVTPTGAALVGALADGFTRWPSFAPERVGWGLGNRRLPDRPNALRAVLGAPTDSEGDGDVTTRTRARIEATMDDATGELLGRAAWVAARRIARCELQRNAGRRRCHQSRTLRAQLNFGIDDWWP